MASFSINKAYAEQYEKKKRAEELSKLQDKYGGQLPSSSGDDSDSTSEEEDEEGEEDTVDKSRDFLRTLSLLKKRDPRIYDKDIDLYRDTANAKDVASSHRTDQASKPLYLKDYERERLLGKEEMTEDSGTESEEEPRDTTRDGDNVDPVKMAYDQEQRDIRESFIQAVAHDSDDNNNGGILKIRQRTREEELEEEADYIKWLKGHKAELRKEDAKDMDALRRHWTDPLLDNDEAFLRDFILNKKWIDEDNDRVPHYEDIVGDFPIPDPSDDEDDIDKQDEFEEKFNFRFEEPGGTKITSYPRKVESSLRKTDERRKDKRKERDERKAKEKEQKKEEIRRLKNLKKQEIMEKLEQIKKITGNPVVGFNEEDFEGDFDPAHHDRIMREQFNDDYYEEGVADDDKPQFSDLSDQEDWDNWVSPTGNEEEEGDVPHCEDPDFNMDADYDPSGYNDHGDDTISSKRRRRRQNLVSKAVKRKKPCFDPEGEKEFEEYFNDYYKLDYEDIIGGDLPCRFNYRQTVPNDFGLTTEEILLSEDKELNKWVSLKKAVQYRTVDEENIDVKKYRKKSKDTSKKEKTLVSLAEIRGNDGEAGGSNVVKKDGKGKKAIGGRSKRGRILKKGNVSSTRMASYGLSLKKKNSRKRTKNS